MEASKEFMKKVHAEQEHKCKGISQINIVLDDGAIMPTRSHDIDAGLDIYSPEDATLWQGAATVIDSKLRIEIPAGYVGYIRSRSSMLKRAVIADGTIDAGYTGKIGIILINTSDERIFIKAGDKVAQLVIHPIETPAINVVEALNVTERGDCGFGSTGR